jgi:F-type H+-transporting ATPase subunit b|tara:strand:+ start:147535 stop:148017 length:483 start_codon:yes stop_codon:yes gene_type:complete
MPQFDIARVALPQIVWLLISFGILFLLMRSMLPKVVGVAERRSGTIGGDLDAADKARLDAEARREAYETSIAKTRAEAQDVINDAKADAARENEAKMKAADAAASEKMTAAEAELRAAKDSALQKLEAIAADATQDIVERLTGNRPPETEAATAVAAARG